MDILFKNATVVTVCDEEFVINDCFLGIDNGKITYLSKNEPKIKAKREIDAKGKVIMPGLVNAHTHIPMSALRGFADDFELQEWLFENIFPAEQKLDAKCVEIASALSVAEMISTGTTSITDMYFNEPEVAKVVDFTGIRANLCNASLCFDSEYNHENDNAYKEFIEMYDTYKNHDRIKIDAGIHGEYTSNKNVWNFWAKTAKEKSVNMHIHVSETMFEHEECKKRHDGKTPTEILNEHGVFDTKANLAHCVFIEENDMKIIAEKNATVVHNPVSNLKLGSGIADIYAYMKNGVNVALGTDGVASNNTHDLFEEIKLSAILAKGKNRDASILKAQDVIKMATINGAFAQNRDDIGQIKIGMNADIIMLDFSNISHTPTHNVLSSIVYNTSGRDVLMTIVGGKILYENGKFTTIDIEKIKQEIENYVIPRIKN